MKEEMITYKEDEVTKEELTNMVKRLKVLKFAGHNYHVYRTDYLLDNLDREYHLLSVLKESRRKFGRTSEIDVEKACLEIAYKRLFANIHKVR